MYQYNSVSFFGTPKQKLNGSYVVEMKFDSLTDAQDYLLQCVDQYAQRNGTEEEIEKMRQDAINGYLTYDAVTATIEEVEENEKD